MDIQIDYTSKFIFRMIHYSNLEFILKHDCTLRIVV